VGMLSRATVKTSRITDTVNAHSNVNGD
jgi:hypothetical protein